MKRAILLSGGLDSIALAYLSRPSIGVTINYGQNAADAELAASSMICDKLDMEHLIVEVDCRSLGSGDLVGEHRVSVAPESDWWPYRNQLLVTLAAMKVIQYGVDELMLGTVKSDSYHVDGTPDFYRKISSLMSMQEGWINVTAPAINWTTEQLIEASKVPLGLLAWGHSCHKSNLPCGQCRGCNKYSQIMTGIEIDFLSRAVG